MSKYEKLWRWISGNGEEKFKLTYTQIEELAGVPIDHSFLKFKSELLDYGYQIGKISMKEETVAFVKVDNEKSDSFNMLDFIKSRRSTRRFRDIMVPDELLKQVIEAGRFAPSGGNSQTTHFIVIKNRAVLDELALLAKNEFAKMEVTASTYKSLANSINAAKKGDYVFHYNCPVFIVTANRKDYGNNMVDCACALENMMLMANALDLGSVWINQLRWLNENPVLAKKLKELGLEDGECVYGALALGYADTQDGLPNRTVMERTGNKVTYID